MTSRKAQTIDKPVQIKISYKNWPECNMNIIYENVF
jgi:hypothetical protein